MSVTNGAIYMTLYMELHTECCSCDKYQPDAKIESKSMCMHWGVTMNVISLSLSPSLCLH